MSNPLRLTTYSYNGNISSTFINRRAQNKTIYYFRIIYTVCTRRCRHTLQILRLTAVCVVRIHAYASACGVSRVYNIIRDYTYVSQAYIQSVFGSLSGEILHWVVFRRSSFLRPRIRSSHLHLLFAVAVYWQFNLTLTVSGICAMCIYIYVYVWVSVQIVVITHVFNTHTYTYFCQIKNKIKK